MERLFDCPNGLLFLVELCQYSTQIVRAKGASFDLIEFQGSLGQDVTQLLAL